MMITLSSYMHSELMIQGRDAVDTPLSDRLLAADAEYTAAGCEAASTSGTAAAVGGAHAAASAEALWIPFVGSRSGNGSAAGLASSAPAGNGDSGDLTQEEFEVMARLLLLDPGAAFLNLLSDCRGSPNFVEQNQLTVRGGSG